MSFNISDIRNSIEAITAGGGLARPCRYAVVISDPSGSGITRNFTALINASELPGKGFATHTRQTYGPARKIPYLTQYSDITMSIICTGNMAERTFFDAWQNKICNVNSNYFTYYDDYVAPINIYQLNEQGISTYSVQLEEAYPVTVLPQQLSYDASNQTMILQVVFAYHKWRNYQQAFDDTGSGTGHNLINNTINAPTADELGGHIPGLEDPTIFQSGNTNSLGEVTTRSVGYVQNNNLNPNTGEVESLSIPKTNP